MDMIDRQAAIAELNAKYHGMISDESMKIYQIINWLDNLPSAEPQERKTGYWQITDAYPHNVYCSKCHKRFAQTHWAVWEDGSLPRKFCPNCGSYNGGGDEA